MNPFEDDDTPMVHLPPELEAYAAGELSDEALATLRQAAERDPYLAELLDALAPSPRRERAALAAQAEEALAPPWWHAWRLPFAGLVLVPALVALVVLRAPAEPSGWDVQVRAGTALVRGTDAVRATTAPGNRVELVLRTTRVDGLVVTALGSGAPRVLSPELSQVEGKTRVVVWMPDDLEADERVTLRLTTPSHEEQVTLSWSP
jgi:hypothetical protein